MAEYKTNPATEAYKDVMQRPVEHWVSSEEMIGTIIYPLNERMAIKYPEMAMMLSHKNTSKLGTALFWNAVCEHKFQFRYQSKWMSHKKPEAKEKAKKSKDVDILENDEIIRGYAKQYKYDYQSVIEAIQFYPDDMRVELKEYENDFIKISE